MSDSRFPILGTTVPPMLGRAEIMDRMMSALFKETPDHIQMVGPRFAGKTVILHELAARLRHVESPYSAVVLWDLGHQTPQSDELFMHGLASELSSALKANHADYAEHLKDLEENPYQNISDVLDILKEEGFKILVIMDGFDKPLSNGQLTRNLWDQLRELALKPSLRLITASRDTLRDLIRDPDSQTSDFWNIFEPNPVRVRCFDKNEIDSILESLSEYKFETGAITELWNSSNGFSILIFFILNAVCKANSSGNVSHEIMKTASDTAYAALHDHLDTLWVDCTPTSKDLLHRILEEEVVSRTGIAITDINILTERGFVQSVGNKLQKPNRLLIKYTQEQPHESNALVRLFGDNEAYIKNLRGVYERRINQIEGLDATLKQYLMRGVEDLPKYPEVFLINVGGILNQTLLQIWKAECWNTENETPNIPSEWFSLWEKNKENARQIDDWKSQFPDGGARLRLLDLITGTEKTARLSRYVSKNTYVLTSSVLGFRNFANHPFTTIRTETAYAALNNCIELAACLSYELKDPQRKIDGQ